MLDQGISPRARHGPSSPTSSTRRALAGAAKLTDVEHPGAPIDVIARTRSVAAN
jgi:hypothetical protein